MLEFLPNKDHFAAADDADADSAGKTPVPALEWLLDSCIERHEAGEEAAEEGHAVGTRDQR